MSGRKLAVVDGILRRLTDDAPQVIVKLLPEVVTQAQISPRTIIDHSNAGASKTGWEALWKYMARTDIVMDCHCLVDMTGLIVQCLPFHVRADCNFKANTFAISFETQDNGSPSLPYTPWTPEQFEALAQAHAALCDAYDIRIVQPSAWDASGIGHHSLYPEWSSYAGKTCPGAARIAQMPALRARVATLLAPPASVTLETPIPPSPGVMTEDDVMLAIYQPSGNWWPAGYDPAWFVVFSSGAVRRAVTADVKLAQSKGLSTEMVDSPDHYKELLRASGSTYPSI
ncbi:MAG TPA: peptidoglycan recognition family protein [Acidimicrobiia bacterium]|nr:peptidoglycan recognition family protein [Acidimicrobiia bacterium]